LHERRPPLLRVPGIAVFLNRGKETAPLAMRANVEHHKVLLEHGGDRVPDRGGHGLLLRVHHRAASGQRADHGQWRKRLFIATSAITADAAEYFRLPRDRTVIVGAHVEV
jgi:KUP system potassium uptake protein